MGDLTLEEYRNTVSPDEDLNEFLREEAQKFFGANFGKGMRRKKIYGRYAGVGRRGRLKFNTRRLSREGP
jgi:hypothetical protein